MAVHIFQPRASLIENVFGFGPPRICHFCPFGFLDSMLALNWSIAPAICIGLVAGSVPVVKRRLMAVLAALWTAVVASSFYDGYIRLVRWRSQFSGDPTTVQSIDEVIASYLTWLPVQLAFDFAVLFAIPACLSGFLLASTRTSRRASQ